MAKAIVEFCVCEESDRRAALRLALAGVPTSHRQPLLDSLAALKDEPLGPFDALVVAKKGPRLLGATWAQPQPGRTASLWPPRRVVRQGRSLSENDLARLVEVAMLQTDARGVSMTQTLLESDDDPVIGPLQANGFRPIATLLYLEWLPTEAANANPATMDSAVSFEAYKPDQEERLKQVVEATYRETLDCPGLDGMRNLSDALSGYRQVGEHDPALWFFVKRDGFDGDAGVLLLTEHPATQQMELVYMGVVPSARGEGLGLKAIRHGQRMTIERGRERMVLAVDAENTPARQAYTAAGFSEWARRLGLVRKRNAGVES